MRINTNPNNNKLVNKIDALFPHPPFSSYLAVTTKSLVTLSNALSQPVNSNPSTAGAVGAVAAFPSSTVTVAITAPSLPLNVTV